MSKQVPSSPPRTGLWGYFTQPAVVSIVSWFCSLDGPRGLSSPRAVSGREQNGATSKQKRHRPGKLKNILCPRMKLNWLSRSKKSAVSIEFSTTSHRAVGSYVSSIADVADVVRRCG